MLVALDFQMSAKRQIVIAGRKDDVDTGALLAEVQRHFLPHKVVLLADGGDEVSQPPGVREMKPVNGKAAAYVCQNFSCQAPVTDAEALGTLLRAG